MSWKYRGQRRPAFAEEPGPGQESVWDYPRPPILVADDRRVVVRVGDELVADSVRVMRLLETASAPGFYIPRDDIHMGLLREASHRSLCEWKGMASYFDFESTAETIPLIAWSYLHPPSTYAAIAGHLSFYPHRIECYVDGERARPQAGGFYGGWVTADVVGPVKGAAGTSGW